MGKTAAVTAASYFEYRHQSRHPLTFDLSSNLPAAAASASPPFRSWPTALQLTNPLSLLAESLLSTNERQEKKIDKWQHRFRHSCRCLRQFVDFPTPKKKGVQFGVIVVAERIGFEKVAFAKFRCLNLQYTEKNRFWQNFNLKTSVSQQRWRFACSSPPFSLLSSWFAQFRLNLVFSVKEIVITI